MGGIPFFYEADRLRWAEIASAPLCGVLRSLGRFGTVWPVSELLKRLGTGTPWGTTRWSIWDTCHRLYHLTYHEGIRFDEGESDDVEVGLDASAVGTLVHAVQDYAGKCVLKHGDTAKATAKIKAWGGLIDDWHKEDPNLSPEIDECERLMKAYFLKWGHENAGWGDAKLVGVERYVGVERRTTQIDLVLEIDGELWVSDHKTRKSKPPADFVHKSAVNPQFLRTMRLAQQVIGRSPAGLIVNAITKTKIPQFSRHDVPYDGGVMANYLEASAHREDELDAYEGKIREAAQSPLAGQESVEAATIHRRSLTVMNFSMCAPTFGFKCRAFDVCHPSIKDLKPE